MNTYFALDIIPGVRSLLAIYKDEWQCLCPFQVYSSVWQGIEDIELTMGMTTSIFPGEENGNPLQYYGLENSMDRGAWQATVHGVTKSQT